MKNRFLSTALALCVLFLLLPINASAVADTPASNVAQAYQNALLSASLYRYGTETVAFCDLNGDTLPEMLLWTENRSNPSLTDIQVWSSQSGEVKNTGTITWGMASSGYSLYVNNKGQLVSYGSTSSESCVWIYLDIYSFSSSRGLEQIETVKLTQEYDMNLHSFGKLTCEVNGVIVSAQEANVRKEALGKDIATVLFGESSAGHPVGMSKSEALDYLSIESFFDVPRVQYYAAPVAWAVKHGITNGTSDYAFSPNRTCTRAQILTFLWRAAGSPSTGELNPFTDVRANDYFCQAAIWAYQKGMVSGTVFAGTTPCTRSATVTYLWQYAGCPESEAARFYDVPTGAAYASAVGWAVQNGITDGVGNNLFAPERICTRGQIVTFLYRARNIQTTAESDSDGWFAAYRDFLFSGAFLRQGQTYYDETSYIVSLFDMDKDGIPEIKIDNGSFGRSTRCAYLYTYADGAVRYLGIGPTDAFFNENTGIGIYGYYQASYDEIHCTLYQKTGDKLESVDKGWYTGATWPEYLTRLYDSTVDGIHFMGWDFFVRRCGIESGQSSLTQLSLPYSGGRTVTLNWGLSLFYGRSDNGLIGTTYNENLAKAAVVLCDGTYIGETETEARMAALGFSDPVSRFYEADQQTNTSPITVASAKTVIYDEPYLIVAVAIRGTDSDLWDFITDIRSGLFNVDGFSEAGETGMEIVRDYCRTRQQRYQIDMQHTILFTTGHSLGAAIAGQIAGNLEGDVAAHERIFSYTFASPYYETHGKQASAFPNIHNIVNTEDAVPKFPLGGSRYGVDETFKGTGSDILDQHMLDTYLDGILSGVTIAWQSVTGGSGR